MCWAPNTECFSVIKFLSLEVDLGNLGGYVSYILKALFNEYILLLWIHYLVSELLSKVNELPSKDKEGTLTDSEVIPKFNDFILGLANLNQSAAKFSKTTNIFLIYKLCYWSTFILQISSYIVVMCASSVKVLL